MERVGRQYIKSKRAGDFPIDLLLLETPNMFQCPALSENESSVDAPIAGFVNYLRDYITTSALKDELLRRYVEISVSSVQAVIVLLYLLCVIVLVFPGKMSNCGGFLQD